MPNVALKLQQEADLTVVMEGLKIKAYILELVSFGKKNKF
jgi:hypothetical protein